MSYNISDKDRKDWNDFLNGNEKLSDKDINPKNNKKLKVRSIDLHGFGLDEANKKIEHFIFQSHSEGINKLRVVTGKGLHSQNYKDPYVSKNLGMLKYSIPEFINNNKDLMAIISSFEDAKIDDGGEGAFYIILKKQK